MDDMQKFMEATGLGEEEAEAFMEYAWDAICGNPDYYGNPEFLSAQCDYGKRVLSDMACKHIQERVSRGEQLSDDDVAAMLQMSGMSDGMDYDSEEDWEDGMVEEYANNLRNYTYTYKDEAREVDPSIDPEEEHRGPMAQHIEKVAPDCVKETDEGVKTVDGNRLALVNSGVIGALARRLLRLEGQVSTMQGGR